MPDPEKLFSRLDKDKDGQLSPEEFTQGMKRLQRMRRKMEQRRPGPPHEFDRPGPPREGYRPGPPHEARGPWPPCERGARPSFARGPMPPHAAAAHRKVMMGWHMFKEADANQDGKVTMPEAVQMHREKFKKLLARADKDGDKAISAEEAKAAVEEMMVKHARVGKAGKVKPADSMAVEGKKKAVAVKKHEKKKVAERFAAVKSVQAKQAKRLKAIEGRLKGIERALAKLREAEDDD